jgi:hypothetical protein
VGDEIEVWENECYIGVGGARWKGDWGRLLAHEGLERLNSKREDWNWLGTKREMRAYRHP